MGRLKMSYQLGDIIPSHFNPAIVAASYFASLCGCLLTVELLHRRGTGVSNVRSWLETLACASSLGVIGIWCMHWIGNRAITLGNGESDIQLVYSSGFSTLSVFLPIFGLCIAFGAAEVPSQTPAIHWLTMTCTGVFAGLSVVGMHYIGNFGISNYRLTYEAPFLAASMIIAIGDCLAVLILFYFWREKWISHWWKRMICAVFLAGGVSAMHFTASTRCIYVLKSFNGPSARYSRNVQVIIAGVLCSTAALLTFGVLFFTRHRARVRKRGAQKIMVACAMFDPDGRILVTTEGVLPAREITDKFQHRTFDEEFDRSHPVFQWIFRVSRNWPGVSDLVPKMRSHLAHRGDDGDSISSSPRSSVTFESDSYSDYAVLFRERFCTAAASLASAMHIPLENIGVLYDHIVDTGTLKADAAVTLGNGGEPERDLIDIETGLQFNPIGKGQLLFLTRRLKAEETSNMLNAGFKIASIQQVGRNIAEAMQIPLAALNIHMSALAHYVDSLSTLEKPGTWLGCFALLPKANSKGFDVAVKRNEQDQLPDVQFLPSEPLPWQAAFLERLSDKTTANCVSFLEDKNRSDVGRSLQEQGFAAVVLQAMNTLRQQLPAPLFQNARFHGKPLQAYYSEPLRNKAPVTTIYSIVICADLHTSLESFHSITRIPLSFFRVRHQCYGGSPNHLALARDIHREFAPLLAKKELTPSNRGAKNHSFPLPALSNKPRSKIASRRQSLSPAATDDQAESSSDSFEIAHEPHLPDERADSGTTSPTRDNFLGGILVNSETVINTSSTELNNDNQNGSINMGMKVAVGTSKAEETFVDELIGVTRVMIPSKVAFDSTVL